MSSSPVTTTASLPTRDRAISATLTFAVFGYALAQTLVFPALSTIQADLGASPAVGAWIVTGFLLSSAILTPVLGALGDARGPRLILLAALVLATLGGIGGAGAPNTILLIGARIVQGVSLGILPLSFAIVRRSVSEGRQQATSGLLTGTGGAGAGVGLVIGGILIIPRDTAPPACAPGRRFDFLGATVLAAGLVTILIGLTQDTSWGWTSPGVWVLIVVGILILLTLAPIERRRTAPLVDVTELRDPGLVATHLTALLIGAISFPFYLLLPLWAQAPTTETADGPVGFGGTITPRRAHPASRRAHPPCRQYVHESAGKEDWTARSTVRRVRAHPDRHPRTQDLAHPNLAAHCLLRPRRARHRLRVCLPTPPHRHSRPPVTRTGAANGFNNIARSIGSILTTQIIAAIATAHDAPITDQTLTVGLLLTAALTLAGILLTPMAIKGAHA